MLLKSSVISLVNEPQLGLFVKRPSDQGAQVTISLFLPTWTRRIRNLVVPRGKVKEDRVEDLQEKIREERAPKARNRELLKLPLKPDQSRRIERSQVLKMVNLKRQQTPWTRGLSEEDQCTLAQNQSNSTLAKANNMSTLNRVTRCNLTQPSKTLS